MIDQVNPVLVAQGVAQVLIDLLGQHTGVLEHFLALGQLSELVDLVIGRGLVVVSGVHHIRAHDVFGHRHAQRDGRCRGTARHRDRRRNGQHTGDDLGVVERLDAHIPVFPGRAQGFQLDVAEVGIGQAVDQVERQGCTARDGRPALGAGGHRNGRGGAFAHDGGAAVYRNGDITANAGLGGSRGRTTQVGQHVVVHLVARHGKAHRNGHALTLFGHRHRNGGGTDLGLDAGGAFGLNAQIARRLEAWGVGHVGLGFGIELVHGDHRGRRNADGVGFARFAGLFVGIRAEFGVDGQGGVGDFRLHGARRDGRDTDRTCGIHRCAIGPGLGQQRLWRGVVPAAESVFDEIPDAVGFVTDGVERQGHADRGRGRDFTGHRRIDDRFVAGGNPHRTATCGGQAAPLDPSLGTAQHGVGGHHGVQTEGAGGDTAGVLGADFRRFGGAHDDVAMGTGLHAIQMGINHPAQVIAHHQSTETGGNTLIAPTQFGFGQGVNHLTHHLKPGFGQALGIPGDPVVRIFVVLLAKVNRCAHASPNPQILLTCLAQHLVPLAGIGEVLRFKVHIQKGFGAQILIAAAISAAAHTAQQLHPLTFLHQLGHIAGFVIRLRNLDHLIDVDELGARAVGEGHIERTNLFGREVDHAAAQGVAGFRHDLSGGLNAGLVCCTDPEPTAFGRQFAGAIVHKGLGFAADQVAAEHKAKAHLDAAQGLGGLEALDLFHFFLVQQTLRQAIGRAGFVADQGINARCGERIDGDGPGRLDARAGDRGTRT